MVSSSSNNFIQKSKSPIIHTKIIISIQVSYFSIPLIFFSSSCSSPPPLLLLPFSSLFFLPIHFCLSPKTKMRYLFWSYPYLILIFFIFEFLVPKLPSICTSIYSNSYFGIQSFVLMSFGSLIDNLPIYP